MITLLPLPEERTSAAARELAARSVEARRTARAAYVQAHCAKLRDAIGAGATPVRGFWGQAA